MSVSTTNTLETEDTRSCWRVFSRPTAWVGIAGTVSLIGYSVTMTFTAVPDSLVMTLAAPGGLLMIAWYAMVARQLLRLREVRDAGARTEQPRAKGAGPRGPAPFV
ncbi:MAG: hypothetical protein ACYC77_04320 [Coriobacteriia bacterium]